MQNCDQDDTPNSPRPWLYLLVLKFVQLSKHLDETCNKCEMICPMKETEGCDYKVLNVTFSFSLGEYKPLGHLYVPYQDWTRRNLLSVMICDLLTRA